MAKDRRANVQLTHEESAKMLGAKMNFDAAEAYKLLRTNLSFSFTEESGCKIIGVTSTMKGEGKSTTAVNLAYTMGQEGRKVLLIEGDLRMPTMAKRLSVKAQPGLTNLLVGRCSGNDVLQKSGLISTLWVITAGNIPPNPTELLGSNQMKITVEKLREVFDVIILDLPPVNAVSDAAVVSKLVDGIVMVVRQDFCDRRSLDEAVRQLQFSGSKILGFVMTGSAVQKKNYKRYGEYK